MQMLILLPIACWGAAILLFRKLGLSRREALLSASVSWGVLLTFITESLSLFGALTKTGLAAVWGLATVLLVAGFFRLVKKGDRPPLERPSRTEIVLFGGISLLCLATLITALAAPPNTWDSMTYHMGRVVHWLQNGSVAHYPTHIVRQIELNPWSEFAIAHFQALSNGDRFANIIQWFSMIGSLVAATVVAARFGADRRGQIFAAVLAASIPMGILQASSSQNDLVVSFWLLCFAWSGLRLSEERHLSWALMAGASLGLALLTKGTAYVYALPFVLWFLWRGRCKPPWRFALLIITVILPVLLLNAGHYSRNWALFSNPLNSGDDSYTNEVLTVKTSLSNIVRNAGLHLSTPFAGVNQSIAVGIVALHNVLGIDSNDPRTTWGGTSFGIPGFRRHEDSSGNLLHAVLAFITLGLVVGRRAVRRSSPGIASYVLAVTAGFLLFCLILKWQPWHSRLHLPLFLLGAPAIAVVLGRVCQRGLVITAAALLLVAALPYALWNVGRPLAPSAPAIIDRVVHNSSLPLTVLTAERTPQYFSNRPELFKSFIIAARGIKASGATNIGLKLGGDDWEYPLWALVKAEGDKVPRFEHIDVENQSRTISLHDFRPDLIVIFDENGKPVVTLPGTR